MCVYIYNIFILSMGSICTDPSQDPNHPVRPHQDRTRRTQPIRSNRTARSENLRRFCGHMPRDPHDPIHSIRSHSFPRSEIHGGGIPPPSPPAPTSPFTISAPAKLGVKAVPDRWSRLLSVPTPVIRTSGRSARSAMAYISSGH
jgi:hypothetical protein